MAESKKKKGKFCRSIENRQLLIKMHYFLIYGGIFIIEPYFFDYALQLGFNYSSVSLTYIILTATYMFTKPIIGAISDRFGLLKTILMILVTFSAILWWMILLIPPIIRDTEPRMIPMKCDKNTSHIIPSIRYNSTCFASLMNSEAMCNFRVEQCHDVRGINVDYCSEMCNKTIFKKYSSTTDSLQEIFNYGFIKLNIKNSLPCDCVGTVLHLISCNQSSDTCFFIKKAGNVNYEVMKFWSFAALIFVSGTAIANALSLTDAATCKLLNEDCELYGRQRLWGTVSVVLCTLMSRYLVDKSLEESNQIDCTAGLCIMSVLFALDLIVIYNLDLRHNHMPDKVFKKVGHVFTSIRNISFATGIFLIGLLAGILSRYKFLYLIDLEASEILLIFTIVVAGILGEIPYLFASGKLIDKFGRFSCLVSAFALYTLRYTLYFFLRNPWYTLPVEILDGLVYGIFLATTISFVHIKAYPGTEATMIGVLGGLYDGLGSTTGRVLSRISVSNFGGPQTFLIAAIISGIFVFVFFFINLKSKTTYARTAMRHNRW